MTTIRDPKQVNAAQLLEEILAALPILGADEQQALISVSSDSPEGGVTVWLDDSQATLVPEVEVLIDAHVALPVLVYGALTRVDERTRTTDDQALTVFTFPCDLKTRYTANLTITGIDAANFVSRDMEGRFVWKRTTGNAIVVGITVVSTLGEAASSSWAPNCVAAGTDVVFTVKGAAGRTIDWLLVGAIQAYVPEGKEVA